MKRKNAFRLAAIFAVLVVPMLFAAFTTGQALNSSESYALQETIVPTVVIEPTIIIPDTGTDDDPGVANFFSGWVFWVGLGLLAVVFFLIVGRPASTPPHRETHDHHDEL